MLGLHPEVGLETVFLPRLPHGSFQITWEEKMSRLHTTLFILENEPNSVSLHTLPLYPDLPTLFSILTCHWSHNLKVLPSLPAQRPSCPAFISLPWALSFWALNPLYLIVSMLNILARISLCSLPPLSFSLPILLSTHSWNFRVDICFYFPITHSFT